ncbi:panthothenate synthetase [Geomesophilobacter sediminis]|uniref:Panthothenate synthetase n=1 Tax=Geomesophilobacter sediminis TaxID=2798584 RepID=A0A8J7LVZ2_9BACT|nr:panthothenate synthetase [Geomesophilobacter sediminis]MBJ6726134.1 panthothenate synthetase [Geomesophilobacter sediminis]
MRMLLNIKFPNEQFNQAVRKGNCGSLISRIVEEARAEAVYFTEQDGQRSVIMVTEVTEPSKIPALAEPWFLNFNATVELRIVMSFDDLKRSGIDDLGRKWGELSGRD